MQSLKSRESVTKGFNICVTQKGRKIIHTKKFEEIY